MTEDKYCRRCNGLITDDPVGKAQQMSCTCKFVEIMNGENEKTNNTAHQYFQDLAGTEFHGHPGFYKLLADMAKLHSRKNHDYAGEGNPLKNFYKCKEQGIEPWRGIMVRLSDKWSRLENFCRQGVLEVKGESVVDTLMDNAVYSLLAILLFEEEYEKKEKNE